MLQKLNDKERAWLKNNIPGNTATETAAQFKKQFKWEFTENRIRAYRKNHKIPCGVVTRFMPGNKSWNAGKTLPAEKYRRSSTVFKKGNVPHNKQDIGTEAVKADGYIWVKIADPKKWRQKHMLLWEKEHGPVPKGHKVTFLDGNRLNCNINNLTLVTESVNSILNVRKLRSKDSNITKTGILVATILDKINKIKPKKVKRRKGQGRKVTQ